MIIEIHKLSKIETANENLDGENVYISLVKVKAISNTDTGPVAEVRWLPIYLECGSPGNADMLISALHTCRNTKIV